jgi:GntR family transcriptional regulator
MSAPRKATAGPAAQKAPPGKKAGAGRQRDGALQLSHATPIYVQLIMHFRQQIESGKWPLNSTIPALENLAAEFGVTRATVRQAVGFLQREKLLSSRRGRGTTVIGTPRRNLWQSIPNVWNDLVTEADTIQADVLELSQPLRLPESPQAEHGILAPNYHVIRRLLSRDGIPYLVGTSYIDRRIIDEVGIEAFQKSPLYRGIERSHRATASHGDQTLTLTTADAEIAYLLEVPLGAPIVTVLRWVTDQAGTLIYQSEGQFRSDFVQAYRRLR